MKTQEIAEDWKASFLLKLTRELIENTNSYKNLTVKEDIIETSEEIQEEANPTQVQINQSIINTRKEEIKEIVNVKIKQDSKKISEMEKIGLLPELRTISKSNLVQRPRIRKIPIPPLRIQEPELPATVSYLKPVPTSEEIDLGKLNDIVRDPLVKIMECNGPEENIIVMGIMGRKPTLIKLNTKEIEEIVGKFVAASKIPINEGLFKAAHGNLVISAVISEIAGIKFIIRKISS